MAADKLQDHLAYPPRAMDAERAAAYVGFGRTKFLEMVEDGRMPQPVDIDGNPRWDRRELDAAWDDLKERRADPVQSARERIHARLRQQQKTDDRSPTLARGGRSENET
jgi:predicted DNA-binding transcriptional regulator AlpA